MKFVSNRDIVVHSTKGHSIRFEKGVPQIVPRIMHSEVIEKGILPVDDEGASVDPADNDVVTEPKILIAPVDQFERDDKIVEVMKALVKNNNAKDFTAGGMPSPKSISMALGWKVDTTEVRKVWELHKEALLER